MTDQRECQHEFRNLAHRTYCTGCNQSPEQIIADLRAERDEAFEKLPFRHDGPAEECPTWYDGCHCTVEALRFNIERAAAAEERAERAIGVLVIVRQDLMAGLLKGFDQARAEGNRQYHEWWEPEDDHPNVCGYCWKPKELHMQFAIDAALSAQEGTNE